MLVVHLFLLLSAFSIETRERGRSCIWMRCKGERGDVYGGMACFGMEVKRAKNRGMRKARKRTDAGFAPCFALNFGTWVIGSFDKGHKIRQKARLSNCFLSYSWSGREDLNLRPLQPHCSALPGCATPRLFGTRKVYQKVGVSSRDFWVISYFEQRPAIYEHDCATISLKFGVNGILLQV